MTALRPSQSFKLQQKCTRPPASPQSVNLQPEPMRPPPEDSFSPYEMG